MVNTLPPTPPATPFSAPKKWGLQRTLLVASGVLALCLATAYLFPSKAIRHLTNRSTDLILRATKAPPGEVAIVIVEIDETSLKQHGQWPWPRNLFAQLLMNIQEAGATSIGINVIFPERDRTSPAYLLESSGDVISLTDPSMAPTERLDHDTYLARSLASGPFILGYEFLFGEAQKGKSAECPIPDVPVSRRSPNSGSMPDDAFYQATGALCNYPPLTKAAQSAGFLNGAPDDDGVLRRLPLLIRYGDQKLYPSFALAVLLQLYDQPNLTVEIGDNLQPRLHLADLRISMDSSGNILLGPPELIRPPHFSAADILGGKVHPSELQGKIVLVGSTVSGLAQGYPTPYSLTENLLDLHAAAIRSMVAKVQTVRHPVFPFYEAALSIFLSLVLATLATKAPTILTVGVCLLAAATSWGASQVLFQTSGQLFSPLLPTVVLFINGSLLITLKFRYFQVQATAETNKTLLLLQSSESSLRSILHTVPDIIFRLDAQGNIIFISPAICRYSNSQETLLGSSIFSHVAPLDREKARFRLNERRTGDRATQNLEIRLLFNGAGPESEQNSRFFSISAEGLYQNDPPHAKGFFGTQGIAKDITDRKKLEIQLLQAQKMEVIGNLAAGIAHDLNNILSGLVSYPDLLLLDIPMDNPLHNKISIIQKSGKKAAAIVQDLLSLARRNVIIPEISNMNQIITDYLESAEYQQLQTRYPKIAVQTALNTNLMNINGSAVHLSKVVMNLLHNGMEAMPAGGRIVISTDNVSLPTTFNGYERIPPGRYVCVSVADNGIGIPQADLPKIFEPFFTRKATEQSGTGLGMTIIWATIKDHHGYLDIHSMEGQGTALTVYLPATDEHSEPQQQRVVLEDYLGSETILIVDDDPEHLHIAENMLCKLGYTVHTASGGEQALRVIEVQPVDLVVLDMIMPGGPDGLDTYTKMLGIIATQKILITSGYSQPERFKEIQELGVDIFLQKPFTLEQLGMAVKAALRGPTVKKDA